MNFVLLLCRLAANEILVSDLSQNSTFNFIIYFGLAVLGIQSWNMDSNLSTRLAVNRDKPKGMTGLQRFMTTSLLCHA